MDDGDGRINTLAHEQERRPGQVHVEFEQIQIDAGDAQETDADELFGSVLDLVQTNNLLVEAVAIPSGIAAEHDEQGLAGALRLGPRRFPRRMPAVLRRGLRGGSLGGCDGRGEQDLGNGQPTLHGNLQPLCEWNVEAVEPLFFFVHRGGERAFGKELLQSRELGLLQSA